ncbi:MAG: DUF2236 domain-containing protein, partial [Chitinophagaceae bacterium]
TRNWRRAHRSEPSPELSRLPADPIGRLFSTVTYARKIVFATMESANATIDRMRLIHTGVENSRGAAIPDWAYRDVLFMLIHYSISAFELLKRKLSPDEKQEVFDVFYRVGARMGLKDLPADHNQWLVVYEEHLHNDLVRSHYTDDLFVQYRKHLGAPRFFILKEAQKLVVPSHVRSLLGADSPSKIAPFVPLYKLCSRLKLDGVIRTVLLPAKYKAEIDALDVEKQY